MVKAVYRDNVFLPLDPVDLHDGDEVELIIREPSQIKKMVGAFTVKNIETIEDIIESDIFE